MRMRYHASLVRPLNFVLLNACLQTLVCCCSPAALPANNMSGGWGKICTRISISTRSSMCTSPRPVREGRGKGRRRFAPRGVWRSGGRAEEAEPVVLLAEGGQRPPIPQPQLGKAAPRPRRKDEFHLAEVRVSTCCRRSTNDIYYVHCT